METLILSCKTGGGHNSAAHAIAQELSGRGHNATVLDPYLLVGERLSSGVGNVYIKLVQKNPRLFGIVYKIGNAFQRIPVHSPVYWLNGKMVRFLSKYLEKNHFDVIVSTHIFPAEILAHMRNDGMAVPKVILIATDYTCIPFTEETDCDYFIVPSAEVAGEFAQRGTPQSRIIPYGIPVKKEFRTRMSQEEAKKKLKLSMDKRYILLSGGSIGAGKICTAIQALGRYLRTHKDTCLIVVCGNNQDLYQKLYTRYADHPQICVLQNTSEMAVYMKACDLFISKPGGLSSTEAAVSGIPMIHISPIPGCETKNMEFYASHKMALPVRNIRRELLPAVAFLQDEENV